MEQENKTDKLLEVRDLQGFFLHSGSRSKSSKWNQLRFEL